MSLAPSRRRAIALAVLAPLSLAACSSSTSLQPPTTTTLATTPILATTTTVAATGGFPVTLASAKGSVTLKARPKAIVSLSPTATEDLFAVGAGTQVIAVDDQSNYPAAAPKTSLSGYKPNVEAIAAKNPDLVVVADDSTGISSALAKLGITTLVDPAAKSLDDAYAQIEQLGSATGHTVEAHALEASMRTAITAAVGGAPRPSTPLRVYHELDQTFYSATSTTFIGQLYKLLGAADIADAADSQGSGYPQLSPEYIVKADPNVIFLADGRCCGQNRATVAARPGWSAITAVKNGGVVVLDDDVASRWGPRVVDLVRAIAGGLAAPSK
jgi:iron complex transport system substrate-binding protein